MRDEVEKVVGEAVLADGHIGCGVAGGGEDASDESDGEGRDLSADGLRDV